MGDDKEILIEYAEKIGQLTQGLLNLKSNFDTHLRSHRLDRVMQWVIIGLQSIIVMFLGYLKLTGKIG